MKIFSILVVSAFALFLGGCADQPLVADEDYNAQHPPAAHSPDPNANLPQVSTRPAGF